MRKITLIIPVLLSLFLSCEGTVSTNNAEALDLANNAHMEDSKSIKYFIRPVREF